MPPPAGWTVAWPPPASPAAASTTLAQHVRVTVADDGHLRSAWPGSIPPKTTVNWLPSAAATSLGHRDADGVCSTWLSPAANSLSPTAALSVASSWGHAGLKLVAGTADAHGGQGVPRQRGDGPGVTRARGTEPWPR